MVFTWDLLVNSILLGVGLAMDAFSVSLVNGLSEPKMGAGRQLGIAGTYAGFQFAMPVIGWFCVHNLAEKFETFQKYIPWIALALLLYIGGKMLLEGVMDNRKKGGDAGSAAAEHAASTAKLTLAVLAMQGIATSIDALSVGFTIANYNTLTALIASLIIGLVTLIICLAGLFLGKKFGTKLSGSANILGGVILILIGIKIAFL